MRGGHRSLLSLARPPAAECAQRSARHAALRGRSPWPQPEAAPKDAPYFLELDIEIRAAGTRHVDLDGTRVQINQQVLDDTVWAAECRYLLRDALNESARARRRALQLARREELESLSGRKTAFTEHCTIMLPREAAPRHDALVDAQAVQWAGLVRPLTKPLSSSDAADRRAPAP